MASYVSAKDRVCETSTSVGTGDMVLGGAVSGFTAFYQSVSPGVWFCYEIHAVDATGVPTGEWETGLGTIYEAEPFVWALKRLGSLVLNSADFFLSPRVDFAAGTKHVSLAMVGANLADRKIEFALNGQAVLYVRADGSDTNTGLANTAAAALATPSEAFKRAAHFKRSKIVIGAGTFGECQSTGTDSGIDVEIVGAGAGSTTIGGLYVNDKNVSVTLSGVTLPWLYVEGRGSAISASEINFSECVGGDHAAAADHAKVEIGNYTVSGGAATHVRAYRNGNVMLHGTITFSASVAFSSAFSWASGPFSDVGLMDWDRPIFDLGIYAVTGQRYLAERCSVIDTLASGANYFPGSVAGATASGGQYL